MESKVRRDVNVLNVRPADDMDPSLPNRRRTLTRSMACQKPRPPGTARRAKHAYRISSSGPHRCRPATPPARLRRTFKLICRALLC